MKKENYKDGKKEEDYIIYHENGKIHSRANYKDDKKNGEVIKYDYDETVLFEGIFEDNLEVK